VLEMVPVLLDGEVVLRTEERENQSVREVDSMRLVFCTNPFFEA
jgi:hypothetical protein